MGEISAEIIAEKGDISSEMDEISAKLGDISSEKIEFSSEG